MKQFLIILMLCLSVSSFAQLINVNEQSENTAYEPKAAFTVGVFQGGGGIVGADFEFLLNDRIGLQIGAGLVSFGAAINYHFKPTIRSSFISLSYWHQGVGDSFTQDILGPSYVFRGKKWFTFNIGFGFPLSKGPAWPKSLEQSPIMLTYGIGVYFPL